MRLSLPDRLIVEFDRGLRTLFAPAASSRPVPTATSTGKIRLNEAECTESARMMRVNHTGEVCAQALYQGQALFALSPQVRAVLMSAAAEERDHLAWCEHRLDQLGASTSVFNPAWYAGSFALGMISSLAGDRWSMAFLVETEHQVEQHLAGHLARISVNDTQSRVILEEMQADEARHGESGRAHGAATLPVPVKQMMRIVSRAMTRTSYWI